MLLGTSPVLPSTIDHSTFVTEDAGRPAKMTATSGVNQPSLLQISKSHSLPITVTRERHHDSHHAENVDLHSDVEDETSYTQKSSHTVEVSQHVSNVIDGTVSVKELTTWLENHNCHQVLQSTHLQSVDTPDSSIDSDNEDDSVLISRDKKHIVQSLVNQDLEYADAIRSCTTGYRNGKIDLVEVCSQPMPQLAQFIQSKSGRVESWPRSKFDLNTNKGLTQAIAELKNIQPRHLLITLPFTAFSRESDLAPKTSIQDKIHRTQWKNQKNTWKNIMHLCSVQQSLDNHVHVVTPQSCTIWDTLKQSEDIYGFLASSHKVCVAECMNGCKDSTGLLNNTVHRIQTTDQELAKRMSKPCNAMHSHSELTQPSLGVYSDKGVSKFVECVLAYRTDIIQWFTDLAEFYRKGEELRCEQCCQHRPDIIHECEELHFAQHVPNGS